jgi:6-phosphogluconolactonase (cycloisomerase 2 family)
MLRLAMSHNPSFVTTIVALASLALLSACGGTVVSNEPQPSEPPVAFVYIPSLVVSFAPVATVTGGGISELQMASNGRLSRVSGSPIPFSSKTRPELAADPMGRFLFAATDTSLITYSIAPSTGALTQVATLDLPATAANGTGPMVVDRAGTFLYSATPDGVTVYSIDSSGVLRIVQTIPAVGPCFANGVVLDNAGKFLDVAGLNDCFSTTSFRVDPTTGALSTISSILTGPDGQSGGLAVHPSGNFVYVQSRKPENVILASTNGELTVLGTSFISTFDDASGQTVLMHPSGKFLYETTSGGSLVGIAIRADGTLGDTISPKSGFPLPICCGTDGIALSPGARRTEQSESGFSDFGVCD